MRALYQTAHLAFRDDRRILLQARRNGMKWVAGGASPLGLVSTVLRNLAPTAALVSSFRLCCGSRRHDITRNSRVSAIDTTEKPQLGARSHARLAYRIGLAPFVQR